MKTSQSTQQYIFLYSKSFNEVLKHWLDIEALTNSRLQTLQFFLTSTNFKLLTIMVSGLTHQTDFK